MFDIGFTELALLSVIALLIVGPDKLPGMVRTVGLWVGRIRRYATSVRQDIEREIHAEELRELSRESGKIGGGLSGLKSAVEDTREALGDVSRSFRDAARDAEKELDDVDDFEDAASDDSDSTQPAHDQIAPSKSDGHIDDHMDVDIDSKLVKNKSSELSDKTKDMPEADEQVAQADVGQRELALDVDSGAESGTRESSSSSSVASEQR